MRNASSIASTFSENLQYVTAAQYLPASPNTQRWRREETATIGVDTAMKRREVTIRFSRKYSAGLSFERLMANIRIAIVLQKTALMPETTRIVG